MPHRIARESWSEIDPYIEGFERALAAQGCAEIADYLPDPSDEVYPVVLRELVRASGSSLSWSAPAHLLPNDHIASYDVTITDSNGNTDPFIVKSPSTSLDLSGLLAPGACTATVYAVDSQGFAGAVSAPVSFTIAPAGRAPGGASGVVANPGAPPPPAAASPVASPPDANQPTASTPSLSSASTTTNAASTTRTNGATAGSKHAGHRHAGSSRLASRPRHRSAGRVAHRPIA
jgi:hypothetical protein